MDWHACLVVCVQSMGAMLRSLSVLGVKDIPLAWCIGDNLTAALNVTTMAMKALSEPDTRFAVKAMWAMATMGKQLQFSWKATMHWVSF